MKTTELNSKIFPYILENIDPSGYEITCNTDKEKLQFLYNTFVKEYWHNYNKQYYKGNIYKCFENWLTGLPSAINIEFTNYDIIQLGKLWGSFAGYEGKRLEKREEYIINNWFNLVTCKTFQLFKKYKIDM